MTVLTVLAGSALAGCDNETDTSPLRPAAAARSVAGLPIPNSLDTIGYDNHLLRVEKLSPGFAGIYWDTPTSLTVLHKDTTKLAAALQAIRADMGDIPQLHAATFKIQHVRYSFAELQAFRGMVLRGLDHAGLIMDDLDEVNNRVWFGVESDAVALRFRAAALAAGLATDAVTAEVIPRPQPSSGKIGMRQDTTQGGLYIANNFNNEYCSLGFNFTRWGPSLYMMTAGHCAPPIGSVNSAYWFSQPYQNVQEAQELGDPPATALSGCDSNELCRYSDAVQLQWKNTPQTFGLGLIAAPQPGTASSTWGIDGGVDAYTYFSIVGEAPDTWFSPGTEVSKMGATSGLTRGHVTRACTTYRSYLTLGASILCIMPTDMYSHFGDSGAPVLYGWPEPQIPPATTPVYLGGLHSSGADATQESDFSTWTGIVKDFGTLMTYPGKPCC